MSIVECTKSSETELYEYDKSKAKDVAITYTGGTDKVTAKITIDETDYTFDIPYITADVVSSTLSSASAYTKN